MCVFLTYVTGERYWIGLADEEIEGIWKWVGTDELVSFTDWNPGKIRSHGYKTFFIALTLK